MPTPLTLTPADEAEIRRLGTLYASHFDARDADSFAALYTEDTEVTTPTGHIIKGRDKMRLAVLRTPPNTGWHKPDLTHVRLDGDIVRGESTFEAQDINGDLCRGHYVDTYRRTNEGWRIATRAVVIEERIPPAAAHAAS